jgi:predicted signal transduction protein with EAL and GGDEF domain
MISERGRPRSGICGISASTSSRSTGPLPAQVDTDADNQVLYEALISLARHFDMVTVAEAVETEAEARWLPAAGVGCLQGFHFGAPIFDPPWAGENPAGQTAGRRKGPAQGPARGTR